MHIFKTYTNVSLIYSLKCKWSIYDIKRSLFDSHMTPGNKMKIRILIVQDMSNPGILNYQLSTPETS